MGSKPELMSMPFFSGVGDTIPETTLSSILCSKVWGFWGVHLTEITDGKNPITIFHTLMFGYPMYSRKLINWKSKQKGLQEHVVLYHFLFSFITSMDYTFDYLAPPNKTEHHTTILLLLICIVTTWLVYAFIQMYDNDEDVRHLRQGQSRSLVPC